METKRNTEQTDYYQSIVKLHHSVNEYLSSLSNLIEGINQLDGAEVREAKQQILSCLSNLFQLQKIILKKMKIYMYYFEKRDDLPPSYHMDWSQFDELNTRSNDFLEKNSFLIQNSHKEPIKNMGYFHLKQLYHVIPKIEAYEADPATPWLNLLITK